MSRFSRKPNEMPPDGAIRASQVITTFGPGSMVDLIDQAVLVGGLDYWSFGPSADQKVRNIPEPRLRDVLAEQFRKAGRGELSVEAPFRAPPVGDDKTASRMVGIQALEFPLWFVCQNPHCRALVRARDGLERKSGRCYHQCTGTKAHLAVPVRFVGACGKGHLQDWPWLYFAHRGRAEGMCHAPDLQLLEGASGDFSEIEVRCRTCHSRNKLASAMAKDARPDCDGQRPWLGNEEQEECSEKQRLLVRTASNSYFAQVVSALSVPDRTRALADAVQPVWETIKNATLEDLPWFREKIDKVAQALEGWSDSDVVRAIAARKEGRVLASGPLRTAEFLQFIDQPEAKAGDKPLPEDDFFARKLPADAVALPAQIERVVVAHKLREVRAQIGFTRLEPITPDLEGEYGVEELRIRAAPLATSNIDWLPAVEIQGEGLLICLDEDAVQRWEQKDPVQARKEALEDGYETWRAGADSKLVFPGIRYYMLHSLAHLLINAVSLECGYAASSIRERLYCTTSHDRIPMAAILLSTGTPGAEGTLGGLIEQATRLDQHLRHAFDLGTLCSSDPVCGAHSPQDDRAERHLEGAACHGCLFIAECSCERFNNFLDRALVVPTIGQDPDLAFLRKRP